MKNLEQSLAQTLLTCTLLGCLVVSAVCCAEGGTPQEADPLRTVESLQVTFEQNVMLPSSSLQFVFPGTSRLVAEKANLVFDVTLGEGQTMTPSYEVAVKRQGDVGDLYAELAVADGLWDQLLGGVGQRLTGRIDITLEDNLGLVAQGSAEVDMYVETSLEPVLLKIPQGEVFVGERLKVNGRGFLKPEEGVTWVQLSEVRQQVGNGEWTSKVDTQLPLTWTGQRSEADLIIDPNVFGIRPSRFEATVQLVNEIRQGPVVEETRQNDFVIRMQPTFITQLSPSEASRGQRITVMGRGLLPNSVEKGYGMSLIFDGVFVPDNDRLPTEDFRDDEAQSRLPDQVPSDDRALTTVWYNIKIDGDPSDPTARRSLEGLGKTPGIFQGEIRPLLFTRDDEFEGLSWEGEFRVLPTKQMVYLKFLPPFSTALLRFGLRNVETELRDAILQESQAPYSTSNVEFTATPPTNFSEFCTIEIGGPDPYGRGQFGYDNTFNGVAKDVNNLFLGDYIGGVNAASGEIFNNPFGGVFIESFDFFSPTLNPSGPSLSAEFDRIMAPFMPELGGKPVRGTEWPDGPRRDDIQEAIDMMAAVIGNTVAHEVAHSMGLAYFEGDRIQPSNRFHNSTPGPGFLMDSGSDRPFEERAGLSGAPMSQFNGRNLEYLLQILPRVQ